MNHVPFNPTTSRFVSHKPSVFLLLRGIRETCLAPTSRSFRSNPVKVNQCPMQPPTMNRAVEMCQEEQQRSVDVGLWCIVSGRGFERRRRLRYPPGESLHKSPVRPTNRSQAPHVQAFARTQRRTRDKQWDGGPCRSHRPVPAHVSRDREGTCGHAIRKS